MAPKESNEEAMQRLMKGKGAGKSRGKGKGKGKGKDSGPPSSEQLPEERREELSALLDDFVASEEAQLQMPSNITGLERKFLHEQAEKRQLTTQSFGQGKDRYICIFKQGQSLEADTPAASLTMGSLDRPASYSAVFLDAKEKILDFCERKHFGIPPGWKTYCDHMTICMGPLSDPKTEDYRSVADSVKGQILKYQEGQRFDLKVVSVGQNEDVIALGVIGCVSCNRNPHITVATAPHVPPHASNLIRKWSMLPAEEQFTLSGQLRQKGGRSVEQAPTGASWHGRGFKLAFASQNKGPTSESSWFGVGPQKKAWVEPEDRGTTALVLGFCKEDAAIFVFEELGRTKGGEVVNPNTIRGGGIVVPSVPVYSFHCAGSYVDERDDGPGPEYFMESNGPSYSRFAFLPLCDGGRPCALNEEVPVNCLYGMYHMDQDEHGCYNYWMHGDYPVYILSDQLCRASDECYPPTCFNVSFVQDRVISVDIEAERVTCRALNGDEVLATTALGTLGELRQEVTQALSDLPAANLLLLHSKTGEILKGSDARRLLDLV